jgi:hypothetical protein
MECALSNPVLDCQPDLNGLVVRGGYELPAVARERDGAHAPRVALEHGRLPARVREPEPHRPILRRWQGVVGQIQCRTVRSCDAGNGGRLWAAFTC